MADTVKPAGDNKENVDLTKKKSDKADENELSEEDQKLKDDLDMLVQRLKEKNVSLYLPTLESLRTHIRSSTTSMTSVPKPLKFLREHYDTIKQCYENISQKDAKEACASIVSVLAMTCSDNRECLKYRQLSAEEDIGVWGHEYVRQLTGELVQEWQDNSEDSTITDKLLVLVKKLIPYHMAHNAEPEACDLLMEIEQLDLLPEYVDEVSQPRVTLYLFSTVPYVPDPENTHLLKLCFSILMKYKKQTEAIRVAMSLQDNKLITQVFDSCSDPLLKKQMAFMLARQQIFIESQSDDPQLADIATNSHLSSYFLSLARELDIMEAKSPDDIYKTHMEPSRLTSDSSDSARQNLANSFVNALVNCGFGSDSLLMNAAEANAAGINVKWIAKNKDYGVFSTVASLGLILLWDLDTGLMEIDKYMYSEDEHLKAGALLACGVVSCGIRNECDPALALLAEYVTSKHPQCVRLGSFLGLGLAYAGSNRQDVNDVVAMGLTPTTSPMEVVGVSGLSCGLVGLGSMNDDLGESLLHCMLELTVTQSKECWAKQLALGFCLLYFGKQDGVEIAQATLDAVQDPLKSFAKTLLNICAYAGTGNVLQIQELLHICSEHSEPPPDEIKKDEEASAGASSSSAKALADAKKKASTPLAMQQSIAVIGMAIIAMGEDIGTEMALRILGDLMRYGEPCIRRSVPLSLALLNISNPKMAVIDTLNKYSHDNDSEVALNALFALGMTGAGTNNARLAQMLRQLAVFHSRDAVSLFTVRLAQGLTHLGKGTMTISPFNSDRALLVPAACAGLLATAVACLDIKQTICGKSSYLLYCLALSITPRMLQTFDENLDPLPVMVRVGQAVDVVGQAGKPKTITGFQTHQTPVLLGHGERCELATEEFIPLTPVLEGCVILKKNPDYVE